MIMLQQDLHIHTTYSTGDSSVVPEQTVALVAAVHHARTVAISDHFEIEINNRYVWRTDWKQYYGPFKERFRFVLGSDAHQPNWLGQSIARYVAAQLGVKEHLVF
jgi:histidinol phosphatase-like PHP family hydrolase